jgi:CxxC motif-containing protein
MSNSIFNIGNELQLIINQIIESGGEITEETENALIIKEGELQNKSQSYGYLIKSMEYEVNTIDSEINRLEGLKRVRNNTIKRLKTVLSESMQQFEVEELKTPTLKINFRKSQTVEILDEDLIPKEFKTVKVTTSISKAEIKKAIKNGELVVGADLKNHKNIQIK